jgi:ABC-2 type transport system permease protein
VRNAALTLVLGGLAVAGLSFDPDGSLAEIAGWLAVMWAGLMVVTGPQYVRNDLRSDLLKLDLLRSYPLRGRSVVLAEVAASTLMLTIIQWCLLGIGYLAFLGNRSMVPDLQERTLLLAASVLVLPAINLLSMLIQNGVALLYPAWVRLGSGRTAGVEALGQNLLMVVAFVALLAVTLVLPVAIGGGLYLVLFPTLQSWALIPGLAAGLGVIAFEAACLVDWLGGVFERTDPATAGISV